MSSFQTSGISIRFSEVRYMYRGRRLSDPTEKNLPASSQPPSSATCQQAGIDFFFYPRQQLYLLHFIVPSFPSRSSYGFWPLILNRCDKNPISHIKWCQCNSHHQLGAFGAYLERLKGLPCIGEALQRAYIKVHSTELMKFWLLSQILPVLEQLPSSLWAVWVTSSFIFHMNKNMWEYNY